MKQDLMHKDVHDVNITPEERRNIWQLWRQGLSLPPCWCITWGLSF